MFTKFNLLRGHCTLTSLCTPVHTHATISPYPVFSKCVLTLSLASLSEKLRPSPDSLIPSSFPKSNEKVIKGIISIQHTVFLGSSDTSSSRCSHTYSNTGHWTCTFNLLPYLLLPSIFQDVYLISRCWNGYAKSNVPQVRNQKLPKVKDQALKFCSYTKLTFWQFCAMHCWSHDCMTGEGLLKIVGGGAKEIAGCMGGGAVQVHIAEVLVQWSSWLARQYMYMMRWRHQNHCLILFTIQHFKPEAAEPILPGVKEDDFSSPLSKAKRKRCAHRLYVCNHWTGVLTIYLTDLWPQNSTQNDV